MVSGSSCNEYSERLRIFDDQFSKFEQLKEELTQKDKLILDLQTVVNNSIHQSKSNKMYSTITPVTKKVIIIIFFIYSLIIIIIIPGKN